MCLCRPVQLVQEGAAVEAHRGSADSWIAGTVIVSSVLMVLYICPARVVDSGLMLRCAAFSQASADEDCTVEFIDGEVSEGVPRQQLRVLPLNRYDVSQAMSDALEIESALRAKWTARREEKRANGDFPLAPADVRAGMHVAVNANYGPEMVCSACIPV